MLGSKQTEVRPLTRKEWAHALTQYKGFNWAGRPVREKRGDARHPVQAYAALLTHESDGGETRMLADRGEVLDASATGLSVRSYSKITNGATIGVILNIGDTRLRLSGRVVHCSGFPPSVSIGLELVFDELNE